MRNVLERLWRIGVAAHYLGVVRWAARNLERKEAEAEYRAMYIGSRKIGWSSCSSVC